MNQILAILGAQFGDEGKGKFCDFLSAQFDYVVRYQGGDNAGHTIVFNNNKFKLSLIPSGIFSCQAVIAHGVVLNPMKLLEEIAYLEASGILVQNRLFVSDHCHIILDYHLKIDQILETARKQNSIGTTKKGIGPCYTDKAARLGIRLLDLFNYEALYEKIQTNLVLKNILLQHFGEQEFVAQQLTDKYYALGQKLKPYTCNTIKLLNDAYDNKQKLLLEGAQGILLDLDYGTYPYVTSSHIIGALSAGTGLSFAKFTNFLGLVKAYSTRVGSGPFVTEISDEQLNNQIRLKGNEFGTNTKRPRRIGWLDLVSLKHTVQVSGMNYIALTLVDVLTNIPTIKVCIDYLYENESIFKLKQSISDQSKFIPVYQEFEGWNVDISQMSHYEQLPQALKNYISFIEQFLQVKVAYLSVGPNRKQTIIKEVIHD